MAIMAIATLLPPVIPPPIQTIPTSVMNSNHDTDILYHPKKLDKLLSIMIKTALQENHLPLHIKPLFQEK